MNAREYAESMEQSYRAFVNEIEKAHEILQLNFANHKAEFLGLNDPVPADDLQSNRHG